MKATQPGRRSQKASTYIDSVKGKNVFYCSDGFCYTKEESEDKRKIEKWGVGPAYFTEREIIFLKKKRCNLLELTFKSKTGQVIETHKWDEYKTVWGKRPRELYGIRYEEPTERVVRDYGEPIKEGTYWDALYAYIVRKYGMHTSRK